MFILPKLMYVNVHIQHSYSLNYTQIGKLDFIKIEKFCSLSGIVKRMKRQAIDRKYLISMYLMKGFCLECVRNSLTLVRTQPD